MTATANRSEHTSSDTEPPVPPRDRPTSSAGGGARWALPAVLFAVAVAAIVAGIVFVVRANGVDSGDTNNDALIDKTATTQVIGQVSTALNQVLTYDYRKPQVQEAAAKRWLTGDAPGQYATLFKDLQNASKGQQLSFTTKVSTAAVNSLRGDKAQLLVFLDQRATRASDGATSISAAQVQIGAVRKGKTWQIDELKPI